MKAFMRLSYMEWGWILHIGVDVVLMHTEDDEFRGTAYDNPNGNFGGEQVMMDASPDDDLATIRANLETRTAERFGVNQGDITFVWIN